MSLEISPISFLNFFEREVNGEYMTKRATTRELTELYENGMRLQEIVDSYGISRQRVQQRFKDAGLVQLQRTLKYTLIEKVCLRTLYAEERFSIGKIGDAFGVKTHLIRQALGFHRISKRSLIDLQKIISCYL